MKPENFKRVLIALDYNPTAQKVAETGYTLATAMHAEVFLLHVVSDPIYYSSTEYSPIMGFNGYIEMDPMKPETVNALKKASQEFLDKSKHHLGDESIRTLVKEGDFADTIIKAAKEVQADMIVMGSHSRKWLENIVMGSVTEKVLNHTSIPLFIVPTKG
jgi:nucleotide-binding universal stress UspA family protein